jgi:diguanylate cyclase (GGDEF)-like protein
VPLPSSDDLPTPPGLPADILASLACGVVATDAAGRIQYLNRVAQHLTGNSDTPATGGELLQLLRPLAAEGENLDQIVRSLLGANGPQRVSLRRSDAAAGALELAATPMLDGNGHKLGTVITLTPAQPGAVQQQAAQNGNQDTLTGLLNRRGFEQRLDTLIMDAGSSSRTHALVMLDLDQFKLINDLSGHRAGDALLQQLARRLAQEVHKGDTIARLGGDEFGVLLSNVETSEAASIARRLLATVQTMQFTWDGRIYPLSASIGIVPITERTRRTALALSQADTALYAAKDAGRNRLHIYQPSDRELTRRHGEMEWVAQINQALEQGLFRLAIQPIAPLQVADEGAHYEVLLRMQRGTQQIAPGAFIAAAERYGIMSRVDRWVVNAFLDYLQNHPAEAAKLSLCALNLSGASLGDEQFLDFLMQQIERPHVRPESLCFEVTETAAITNYAHASHFIEVVHARGCRFSLDDFGSGMSSFGYLRQFPVDYLKIDGLFVRDLDSDPVHYAMVKSINEIGHAMGKKTIAEFVANEVILNKLRDMGVDYAQGYHIGEPRLLDLSVPAGRVVSLA